MPEKAARRMSQCIHDADLNCATFGMSYLSCATVAGKRHWIRPATLSRNPDR